MLLREIENKDKSVKQMFSHKKYRVKLLPPMQSEEVMEISDEMIEQLPWVDGEITNPGQTFMIKREDGHIHPISDIVDFELILPMRKKRSKAIEPDYTRTIVWIYQDDYGDDIYIYEGEKVKLKTPKGGYVIGSVKYHEELKKYYVLDLLAGMRYFFLVGCEVEKVEEK